MVTFILFIKKLYSVKRKLLNLKKFVIFFFFNYRIYLHILPLSHTLYTCVYIYNSYSSTFNLMSLKNVYKHIRLCNLGMIYGSCSITSKR